MTKAPFSELLLVTITDFSGTTDPNKNGKYPVMAQCIAGVMPNRNVIDGTVAERSGFEVGKTYLAQMRETGYDKDFGPQFNWLKVQEVINPVDTLKLKKELGEPIILNVEKPGGFDDQFQRQSDAVEGATTERIHMGRFIPAFPRTSIEHKTARDVKAGTSQDSKSVDFQLENLNEGGEGKDKAKK